MGADKASLCIGGTPLWERQLRLLEALQPHQLFIAGPARREWLDAGCVTISDAQTNAGPLAGLVAGLRRSSSSLLLAVAVDLPQMTADYLRELLDRCSVERGVIPHRLDRFEPLAAFYPASALGLAESCLDSGSYSLQRFAMRCASAGLVATEPIGPADEALFLNLNTPGDLLALAADASRQGRKGSQRKDRDSKPLRPPRPLREEFFTP